MRNTLVLLSSLALAAVASAIPTASSSTTMDVSYAIDPALGYSFVGSSVTAPGRDAGEYIYDWDTYDASALATHNPVFEYTDDVSGTAVPVTDPSRYTGSVTGVASGTMVGSDRLVLTSSAAGSFQTVASDAGDAFLFRVYGYRYFLDLTNSDPLAAHGATFTFNLQSRSLAGTIDTPYSFAQGLGQYAESVGSADVAEPSQEPLDYLRVADTLGSPSGTGYTEGYVFPSGGRTFSVPKATFDANGVLVPGFLELEIHATATVFLEDDRRPAAVPEPASFAVLGLGALGLLRRRRKA